MPKKITPLCDHDAATTSFCPHCGMTVKASDALSLRRHLATYVDSQSKALERPLHEHVREAKEKTLEKWLGWLAALDELLAMKSGAGK